MRQGGTQRQHPDQLGQGGSGALGHPADDQLHAQRIDPGQTEANGKAQRHGGGHAIGQSGKSGIAERAEQRTHGKNPAGRKAVGEAGNGKTQGTQNEPELHCIGQRSDICRGDTPTADQIIGRTIGREPQRGAEELGEDDDGNGILHGKWQQ